MLDWRPGRELLDRRKAVVHMDRHPLGIVEPDDRSTPRSVERLDRRSVRLRQRAQILRRGRRQPESEEARLRAARHAVDERPRARSAQEKLILAAGGHEKSKISQIRLRLLEARAFEMDVEQLVGFDDRRNTARQFDAAGAGLDAGKQHEILVKSGG